MNKKVGFVLCIILFLTIACSLVLCFENKKSDGTSAIVYVNNKVYTTIDLLEKKYNEYTIKTEFGYNKIIVDDGKICVVDSDCPDKICIKTGFISGGAPIICMPHRLEIVISANNIDGFSA